MMNNDISIIEQFVKPFYCESHRHYHTYGHIVKMFYLEEEIPELLSFEEKVAILFHDAVYFPWKTNGQNELESIELLRYYYKRYPTIGNIEIIENIIYDTISHIPSCEESEIVLDLDFQILGETFDIYERYALNIRKEYGHLEDHEYINGRLSALKKILNREWIFNKPYMRSKYEMQARKNIQREIDILKRNV